MIESAEENIYMHPTLRIAWDVHSSTNAVIAIECDDSVWQSLVGDFTRASLTIPPLIRKMLETGFVDRIIVYDKTPRLMEIVKGPDTKWIPDIGVLFDIIHDELNPDGTITICDMDDICPEAVRRATA